MLHPLTLFLPLLLALSACEKNQDDFLIADSETINGLVAPVTVNLFGRLVDNTGQPVPAATVITGNKQTTTDPQGLWRIDQARVGGAMGYVQFKSPAHLDGSRTIYAREGSTYEIEVQMLRRDQSYEISGTEGTRVEIASSGATIDFPPQAFAKTDGSPHTGRVRVTAHFLVVSQPDFLRQMPGDLRALRTDAKSRTDLSLLTTYGIKNVEIEDLSGNEVKLANNKLARLSFPIPSPARATAPATIPLWYFDDAGYWVEEGEADRVGDTYVGEVSHFTPWNCDVPTPPLPLVTVCGRLVYVDKVLAARSTIAQGIPVSFSSWGPSNVTIAANGEFCFVTAQNVSVTAHFRRECTYGSAEKILGPFTADVSLGDILVELPHKQFVTLKGRTMCDSVPFRNGCASITQGSKVIRTVMLDQAGNFETKLVLCDTSSLQVSIINYYTSRATIPQRFPLDINLNAGDIDACLVANLPNTSVRLKLNGRDWVRAQLDTPRIRLHNGSLIRELYAEDLDGPVALFAKLGQGIPYEVGTYTIVGDHSAAHIDFNNYRFPLDGQQITITASGNNPTRYKGVIGPVDIVRDSATVSDHVLYEFSYLH